MTRKKVAVIGTVGLPAKYGGFETLAEHLVEEMGDRWSMTVYCSGKKYGKSDRVATHKGARLIYLPLNANGVQSILYDSLSILHALFYADVLLILGVSGGFLLPLVRLLTRTKIVISIDGIEWKRNKWSKLAKIYLWAAEWVAVKFSHADIADNEAIQDYTAIRYKSLSNIIEYGADHTVKVQPGAEDKKKYPFLKYPYAFKVCRIEPENNLDLVLDAFSAAARYPLVVVGNWNNSDYGRALRERYAAFPNIFLLDPIYNQAELDLLRGNCFVYVHGHSAGGTNPSLVEAMYLGLPVLAYGVSYNKATTENKALYFKNREELIGLLETKNFKDLRQVAGSMKEVALRRYTWHLVAAKYEFLMSRVLASTGEKSLEGRLSRRLRPGAMLRYELGHLQHPSSFYEKR